MEKIKREEEKKTGNWILLYRNNGVLIIVRINGSSVEGGGGMAGEAIRTDIGGSYG